MILVGRLLRGNRKCSANLDQFHSLVPITFVLRVHRVTKILREPLHRFVGIHSGHRLATAGVPVGSRGVAGGELQCSGEETALI
jgi:hypothetical protein